MSILQSAIGPVMDAATASLREPMSWADARLMAQMAAADKDEWAGAPLPVDHVRLVLEPRYPIRGLHGMKFPSPEDRPDVPSGMEVINSWYSERKQETVYIWRDHQNGGRLRGSSLPDSLANRMSFMWNTLGVAASEAWTVDAELKAQSKLKELITAQAWKCYVLNGTFLETSKRSQVMYLFRRQRPTLALRPDRNGKMTCLTCLCLHPIGFYEKSWAGVMVPTDDVIAHLLMMRGDEYTFWKKANHHGIHLATAGL